MAEKIKTSAEILAELGIVKNLPVTEILNNVDQNIVPSVEEKIKDSSTEEYSIEEKKDYTKSKILSNKEVDYIDNIKSDKQRNDIMRLKDVFRDNPQFVTEYLNAIKKHPLQNEIYTNVSSLRALDIYLVLQKITPLFEQM